MKRNFITLISGAGLYLCLFSCNGTENNTAAQQLTDGAAVPADTNVNTLVLEKIALGDANNKDALAMSAKGNCTVLGKEVGILSTNGELKDVNGKLLAKLSGEKFIDGQEKVLAIIKEDGTIVNGSGKDLCWGKNGILRNSDMEMYLTPANTKAKRAASILLITYFTFSGSQTPLTNKLK